MLLKIKLFALLSVVVVLPSYGRDIRNIWAVMPDTIVKSVDKVRRLEMLDLIDYKVKAEVSNRLSSESVMDTLTADYLHVSVSKSSSLSMRMLPTADGDTLLCVIYSYHAPETESVVSFYSLDWQPLEIKRYLPFSSIAQAADSLYTCPDSISADRYEELRNNTMVELVSADMAVGSSDIVLSLTLPMSPVADEESLKAITVKRKLVWTGGRYELL